MSDTIRQLAERLYEAGQKQKRKQLEEIWGSDRKRKWEHMPSEGVEVWESIATTAIRTLVPTIPIESEQAIREARNWALEQWRNDSPSAKYDYEIIDEVIQRVRTSLASSLQEKKGNPQVGTCVFCGSAIWEIEARMQDGRGWFHPICEVRKQLADAQAELRKQTEESKA